MRKDGTWLCTCGARHTGHTDPTFTQHQPVSVVEYRFAVADGIPLSYLTRGTSVEQSRYATVIDERTESDGS